MDPTTTTQPSHETNGQRAEVTGIVELLSTLTKDEKRHVLLALLRDMFGTDPKGHWGVYNEDNTIFLHLMSESRYLELAVTPERIAKWRAEIATGERIPLSQSLAWVREELARRQK